MAFTEHGVAMLSSVLRSKRAVQVNIEIMRAFVRLREILSTHKDLKRKLLALERKYDKSGSRGVLSPQPPHHHLVRVRKGRFTELTGP